MRRASAPITFIMLAALLLGTSLFPATSQATWTSGSEGPLDLPVLNASWVDPDSSPMLEETPIPGTSSNAMFAVDITSDEVLYQDSADERVAPASTLKIITALTTLTALDPDDVIQVSAADLVDTTVYSNAQLLADDEVTVEDLLAGLMLPSGGDAANALARVAGGVIGPAPGQSPLDRFVEEMNAIAESIGMTDSNFVNPDGPDHPEQYTTARDMAIAGAELLEHELLSEIVESPVWEITVTGLNARQYTVENTNLLIGADRVHGIKTGTTGEAGQSIVLATRRGDNQIISVVMGSEGRYVDIETLMGHLDDQIRWVEFGASDDFPLVQQAQDRHRFAFLDEFTVPMLRDDIGEVTAEYEVGALRNPALPLRWGVVVFLERDEELYRVPLFRTFDSQN